MHIHFFEHDPMEGIGTFDDLLFERSWTASHTFWDRDGQPPALDSWDLLVVMGGPMNVYEDVNHPWLAPEKAYLDQAIACGRPVLGVCLGAQLLAERLGAPVTRNEYTEIGWSQLQVASDVRAPGELFEFLPATANVFQWHGDTFALPEGARSIGATKACQNQGFIKDNVVGLQFHLEVDPNSLRGLIKAQPHFKGPYIQKPDTFLADQSGFLKIRDWLGALIDRMTAKQVAT